MNIISDNTWGLLAFLLLVVGFCWYSTYLLVPRRQCPVCDSRNVTEDGENCADCGAALRPIKDTRQAR
jgi:hypothetical protein